MSAVEFADAHWDFYEVLLTLTATTPSDDHEMSEVEQAIYSAAESLLEDFLEDWNQREVAS